MDPTERVIATLHPSIQDQVIDFVNAVRQASEIPLIVTSGRRTLAQQRKLVAAGRSRTMQSKHLNGLAFDVDLLGIGRDDVSDDVWEWLGPSGENFGFVWGGRWVSFRDVGHFEV